MSNGVTTTEQVYTSTNGGVVANPISLNGDQVYQTLYGSGLGSATTATAAVGGVAATVQYAGPQMIYSGLDQFNILIPSSLAGAGKVDIVITAGGKPSNPLNVTIRYSNAHELAQGQVLARALIYYLKAQMTRAIILALVSAACSAQTLTIVNSASFSPTSILAPDSIASAFGQNLAAGGANPAVTVVDAQGTSRPAAVFAFAPSQVNFLIPAGTAPGTATVTIRNATNTATGRIEIRAVAPGLFSANGSGRGLAAASFLRIAANGARTETLLAQADSDRGIVPAPVDLAPENGEVYLSLFGTGLRAATRLTVTLNGESIPVLGAAAHSQFAGLDQVNIGPLPASLRARDEAEISLAADGSAANRVTVSLLSSPAAGAWARRAELPEANSEMSVSEADGKIYVLGGYPSNRITVASVQVYNPVANTWRLTTPMPVALNHTMSANVNGKIYIIGGQPTATGAGPFVDTVYEFDPATERWTTRAPMPTARGGGAAAVLNGKIYVAGGRPPGGNHFAVFDPADNTWQTLPALPTQRNHLGAATIGGKIYVIGGRFGAGFDSEQTDRIEIFDPATNTWTAGAPMPHPRGGLNVAAAYGCLHLFGGEGDSSVPSGVHADHDLYNPVTNTWTTLAPMPTPVHGVTGSVFANGLIYLPGGGVSIGGSSGSTIHQVYRPSQTCRSAP